MNNFMHQKRYQSLLLTLITLLLHLPVFGQVDRALKSLRNLVPPSPNAWTYYEHRVTGQTTVSIIGAGNIDELRLYPVNAQMTSYIYSPLVGVTSISDAKNRITYYEYDSFQRLLNIKDKNGSIIKNYSYHYQGQ
jgi:hypothetical protein